MIPSSVGQYSRWYSNHAHLLMIVNLVSYSYLIYKYSFVVEPVLIVNKIHWLDIQIKPPILIGQKEHLNFAIIDW